MRLLILVFLLQLSAAQAQLDGYLLLGSDLQTVEDLLEKYNNPGLQVYMDYGDSDGKSAVYGSRSTDAADPIAEETLIAAGAMSAIPTALIALRLVDREILELDRPVNDYLKGWTIQGKNSDQLTLRQILLYQVSYGADYKSKGRAVSTAYPSVSDILKYELDLRVKKWVDEPAFEYVHWLLVQKILEDVSGMDLQSLFEQEIAQTIGLSHSQYSIERPEQGAAIGHDDDGNVVPFKAYPELGSSGFWTTSKELTQIIRSVFDAAAGCNNAILSEELARQAITAQWQSRSLLFHINDYGDPYMGGNAWGYYGNIITSTKNNIIAVALCNRNLNWKIMNAINPAIYDFTLAQSYKETLEIYVQDSDSAWDTEMLPAIYSLAKNEKLCVNIIRDSFPEDITATPAVLYDGPTHYAVYPDMHNNISALKNFIQAQRIKKSSGRVEIMNKVFCMEKGAHQIALPVKITPPTGFTLDTDDSFQSHFNTALLSASTITACEEIALQPTDRRFYIDIHRYYTTAEQYYVSAEIYSQFNCHDAIWNNFSEPVLCTDQTLKPFIDQLTTALYAYTDNPGLGYTLNPLPETRKIYKKVVRTIIDTQTMVSDTTQEITSFAGSTIQALENTPPVGFYFPSPLDRYNGHSMQLTGTLDYNNGRLSGSFQVPSNSVTMGRADIDRYIIDDVLRAEKIKNTTLSFSDIELKAPLVLYKTYSARIPATLQLAGINTSTIVKADITPRVDSEGNIYLEIKTNTSFNIKNPFDFAGPDGPDDVKNTVIIDTQFSIS